MQNFANQCLDIACVILEKNLSAIQEDGTIIPAENEVVLPEESAHALAAIGEYYYVTSQTELNTYDIVDLGARCLKQQTQCPSQQRALAYSALGLLSFGPAKQRNLIWYKLDEAARKELDNRLLSRNNAMGIMKAFNIAKSVTRYSIGLSKKDETGRLVDDFLDYIKSSSTGGFFSDNCDQNTLGVFDISMLASFVFIRQVLTMHTHLSLCGHKLPSLRTYAEKIIKILPDMVRFDGLGWAYGRGIGIYGQIYCISFILQFLHDKWIVAEKIPLYLDLLRRLFQYFFSTYVNAEDGSLVVRDTERTTLLEQTTRIVNFDTARYLLQWARLSQLTNLQLNVPPHTFKTSGRFICFDKTYQKEQGLFLYRNAQSGLQIQLPLVSGRGKIESDALAFPHCPGIFDWPVQQYLPVLLPELTINGIAFIPSFYGKQCTSGLGLKNTFVFSYNQPELISKEEIIHPNMGSCKITWRFCETTIFAEFSYKFKQSLILDYLQYIIPLSMPHSTHHAEPSFMLGKNSLQVSVLKDDFGAAWNDIKEVYSDPHYKTYYGKICYLQILERAKPLTLIAGRDYHLHIELKPDIFLN